MSEDDAKQGQGGGKSSNMKVILVAGALMILEAGAVVGFMMMTGGGSSAEARELKAGKAPSERTVEIELIQSRFQNMATGRVWDWQTQIYLKVPTRHEAHVRGVMKRRRAEIQAAISKIFRKAQHSHLKEPGLQTITRQVSRYIHDVFGQDPDGAPYVEEVLIPQCDGYPADF